MFGRKNEDSTREQFNTSGGSRRTKTRETEDNTSTTTAYPNQPGQRRRVNTHVNRKHGRYPEGWYSEG